MTCERHQYQRKKMAESGERNVVQTCVRRGKKAAYAEKQQEKEASSMPCFQKMKKYNHMSKHHDKMIYISIKVEIGHAFFPASRKNACEKGLCYSDELQGIFKNRLSSLSYSMFHVSSRNYIFCYIWRETGLISASFSTFSKIFWPVLCNASLDAFQWELASEVCIQMSGRNSMLFVPNLIFPFEVIWGSFRAGALQSRGVSGVPYLELNTAQTKGLTHGKVKVLSALPKFKSVTYGVIQNELEGLIN